MQTKSSFFVEGANLRGNIVCGFCAAGFAVRSIIVSIFPFIVIRGLILIPYLYFFAVMIFTVIPFS